MQTFPPWKLQICFIDIYFHKALKTTINKEQIQHYEYFNHKTNLVEPQEQ